MVYDVVKKALFAGLGVQEKVKELVDDLVKKGEMNEREGAKLMKEYLERARSSGKDINRMVADTAKTGLDKVHIASKDDLDALVKKVQQLSVRVKKLEAEAAARKEEGR